MSMIGQVYKKTVVDTKLQQAAAAASSELATGLAAKATPADIATAKAAAIATAAADATTRASAAQAAAIAAAATDATSRAAAAQAAAIAAAAADSTAKVAAQAASDTATYLPLDPGYDVIPLLGQSNISGRGTPFSSTLDPTNALIFQYKSKAPNANTIAAASEPLDMHDSPTGIGPGLQFARWYAARALATGRKILLVPVAHGGTPLSSTATLGWRRGGVSGNLYANALAQTQGALAAAAAAQPAGHHRVVATLWMQGESDGDNANTGLQYETDLDALINGWRTDLALPALPFIIGTMVPEYLSTGTRNQINAVHRATPNRIANVDVALGATAMNLGDGNHYNGPGQRANGLAMYQAFERISQGIAPYSEALDVPTAPALTPGTATASTIPLSWTASAQATSYTVQYRVAGGSTWTTFTATASLSATITGLSGTTNYEIQVVPTNTMFTGRPSNLVTVTTLAGPPAVQNTTAPAITPTSSVGIGTMLTSTNGAWSVTPDSYTYQWTRDGIAIPGATSATYTAVASDLSCALACQVTAAKTSYTSATTASNTVTASSGVYVSDHFNRADSISTLGTADSGQTWLMVAGAVWGIKSNRAYEVSGANGQAVINTGASDGHVSAILAALSASSTQMRLIFRGDGTIQNFWMVQYRQATGKYQLYKTVAGTTTQVGTDFTPTPAAGDALSVTLSGSSITVTVNGTTVATATDTALQTNTYAGLGMSNGPEVAATFDNFVASV